MERKPIPPPSAGLLLFPERDQEYIYFEDAIDHPFQPDAQGFSPVNAWWLADASVLAYSDAARATPIWMRAGLQVEILSAGGTLCHVAWSDRFVIVAFRGTQPNDLRDWLTNIDAEHVHWEYGAGTIHEGFASAHRDVWLQLEGRLRRLEPSGRSVWFTGHSLGGALATLSMDRYQRASGLYTIGSPPVGDRRFAQAFGRRHLGRSFRFVNHRDLIVRLPGMLAFLVGSYKGVQARKHIGASGGLASRAFFQDCIGMLTARRALRQAIEPVESAAALLPGSLVDHTPRRYAVLIWNAYVDSTRGVAPAMRA